MAKLKYGVAGLWVEYLYCGWVEGSEVDADILSRWRGLIGVSENKEVT